MRGKGENDVKIKYLIGITPAYAGKSRHAAAAHVFRQDHPRLCGEKFNATTRVCCSKGSPPPMRGKDFFDICFNELNRITPAYAGKRLLKAVV